MKRGYWLFLVPLLVSSAFGFYDMKNQPTAVSSPFKIEAETDVVSGVYKLGEPVEFRIRLLENGKPAKGRSLTYSYRGASFLQGKGTLVTGERPSTVRVLPKAPGFLLIKVDFRWDDTRKIYARAGALTAPEKLRPGAPEPADFDDFWNAQKQAVTSAPMVPVVTPVNLGDKESNSYQVFDVQVPTPGAGSMSAYLTMPKAAEGEKLPAMICWHAAGVRSAIKQFKYANMGMMVLDVNAHGLPNGLPGDVYGKLYRGKLKNYRYSQADDRNRIYFNGMYRRLIRAMQFMTTHPRWDGRTLIVYGGSQGGAQALVSAGLEPRVTAVIADEPAMCDHGALFAKRDAGWPRFIVFKNRRPVNPAIAKAVAYYDSAYFAARINPQAEVMMTTGLIDTTCVPSSVYAAYNSIPGTHKVMRIYPQAIHGAYWEFDLDTEAFILRHLKR